jgi:NAD-dependent SIR2 family protein deacetylase
VLEVNREPTPLSSIADASFHGKAGELLPALLEEIRRYSAL